MAIYGSPATEVTVSGVRFLVMDVRVSMETPTLDITTASDYGVKKTYALPTRCTVQLRVAVADQHALVSWKPVRELLAGHCIDEIITDSGSMSDMPSMRIRATLTNTAEVPDWLRQMYPVSPDTWAETHAPADDPPKPRRRRSDAKPAAPEPYRRSRRALLLGDEL